MIELLGVKLPEIKPGDDIGRLICEAFSVEDQDVIVVTSKIVSKAEGRLVKLEDVIPSAEAEKLAKRTGKPAKLVELIIRNAKVVALIPVFSFIQEGAVDPRTLSDDVGKVFTVLERDKSLLLTLVGGSIYTDAGVDFSNVPPGYAILPPENPNKSAKKIRESIKMTSGKDVAVLISDTEVFIGGSIEVCRGYAGICPVKRRFGEEDIYGREKYGGCEALAHEICCAASLLMGQAGEGIPVVVIRGLNYEKSCSVPEPDLEKAIKILLRENVKLIGLRNIISALYNLLKK
ncbi:coenzyme F420-0:L-glutamate ligase [Archaeoglobus sp.]